MKRTRFSAKHLRYGVALERIFLFISMYLMVIEYGDII